MALRSIVFFQKKKDKNRNCLTLHIHIICNIVLLLLLRKLLIIYILLTILPYRLLMPYKCTIYYYYYYYYYYFIDTDDCNPNPCQNGGSCTDRVNGYRCACEAGYEGATCATSELYFLSLLWLLTALGYNF